MSVKFNDRNYLELFQYVFIQDPGNIRQKRGKNEDLKRYVMFLLLTKKKIRNKQTKHLFASQQMNF